MKTRDKLVIFLLFLATFSFVIYHLSFVLTPFIISFVLAYFLHPLVKYFADKKIPNAIAILLIMTLFFGIFGVILSLILPIIYNQSARLIAEIPAYFNFFKSEIYPKYISFLNVNGIESKQDFNSIFNEAEIIAFAKNFTFTIFDSGVALINIFSLIFIMPILIFYILKDWDLLNKNFYEFLPKKSFIKVSKVLSEIDLALSGFIRGQILVCLMMAVIYSLLLSLTGLKFGFLIGFLTGIFTFIPYVGALIGFVAAIFFAFFQWGFDIINISQVVAAIVVGQVVESNFLTPKLIGEKVGLHPVWVIFGIFIFGSIFGIIGVIFATPLTAVFGVLIKNLAAEYKKKFA